MKIYTVDSSLMGRGASFDNILDAIESLSQDFGDEWALSFGEKIGITCEEVSSEEWQNIQARPEWAGW